MQAAQSSRPRSLAVLSASKMPSRAVEEVFLELVEVGSSDVVALFQRLGERP